jgi:acyl-CoA hydrolase
MIRHSIHRRTFFALGAFLAFAPSVFAAPNVVTPQEAAHQIGHGVMFGTGSAMPPNLLTPMRAAALARQGRTNVFYMSTFATAENFKPEVTEKWHPNLFFVSGSNKQAATEGRATLIRDSLFNLGKRLEKDEFPIDTVVVRVSPPDKEGMVSLGTSSDLTMLAVQSVLRRGGKVIAEVNPNVPHTQGNRIAYDSLTHVVHNNELLAEAPALAPMEPEKAIAANIAKLLPTNVHHTLQIGIGNALAGVPDALKGHPLDVWSEIGPSGLIKLVTAPDSKVRVATFSFLHADNEAYKAAGGSPKVTMAPSTTVNDPAVIAQKPNMVAVNTALEVDLLGNVNAERDGNNIKSMPGGQPDFMKGASMAPNGKAIMALRSTAKDFSISTVVPNLKGPTTTPKDHVDHIVTEWGATARLRGQNDNFRAYQVISVSHPAFRGELADAAKARGIITDAQAAELKAGVFASVNNAPADVREALANQVLAKGLITNDQHTQIIVDLLAPRIH